MKKNYLCFAVSLCLAFLLVGCNSEPENDTVAKEINEPIEDVTSWSDTEVFEIDTPIANMKYPAVWETKTRVKSTDDSVSFYAILDGKDDFLLFTLETDDSEGYLVGTMGDTNVYIVENELEFDETWTEEERQTIYDMQDDVNVILQGLIESANFVFAENDFKY